MYKYILLLISFALCCTVLFADQTTIGTGISSEFIPVNNQAYSSLYECIYYQSETRIPYGSTISGIRYYAASNIYGGTCLNHQAKVWIGSTTQTTLNNWVMPAAMTLVFDGTFNINLDQPLDITFSTPYTYNSGNLVVYVYRPYPNTSVVTMGGNPFKVQETSNLRAKYAKIDGMTAGNLNPSAPPVTTPTAPFPKTTFTYTHATIANDLDCMQISGIPMPEINLSTVLNVTIKNKGTAAQSTYLVKLYNDANVEIAAVSGPPISAGQTITVDIPWTPSTLGNATVYAKTILAADTFAHNNRTANNLTVRVVPQRTTPYTIGQGGSLAKMPMDANSAHTLFETIYPASDLDYPGYIYGVRFYSSYVNTAPNQAAQIWLGETDSPNLEQSWINNTGLQLCYSNLVNIYPGAGTVDFFFDTPYEYKGRNLVFMLFRSLSGSTGMTTDDNFVVQTDQDSHRTRIRSGLSMMDITDPANPPANIQPSDTYPKATFFILPAPASPANYNINRTGSVINLDWDDVTQDGAGNAVSEVAYNVYVGLTPDFICDQAALFDTIYNSQIDMDINSIGFDKFFIRVKAAK
jgi:hypothetical protein